MAHGAHQVGAHLFALALEPQQLLCLDTRGQCGDCEAHRRHRQEGERVAVDGEVHLHIRIGKGNVDGEHTCQRGEQPVEVTVRHQGDDQDHQNKDQRYMDVRGAHLPQQLADQRREPHAGQIDDPAPQREREKGLEL